MLLLQELNSQRKTMKNPLNLTNLGDAVSIIGVGLMGVGVLSTLAGASSHATALWYIALTGFILSVIGKGLTILFAPTPPTTKNN
jgi:hypothetical protein